MKVGFFGGSFDPIHFGHLRMAKELARLHHLSEVWFCPARHNPHKLERFPTSIEHRLQMVKLAIEDEPCFVLLDCEAKRVGPSYTVDTLKELVEKEQFSKTPRKIYLILSDETVPGFFHWKQPEEIANLVPLLIGSRFQTSQHLKGLEGSPFLCEAINKGWSPTVPFNISSSEIRQKLFEGQDCQKYVPKKVLDYIFQNKLYLAT